MDAEIRATGDALSVCFNTVAILFLAEVDNVIFQVALPEEVRARVEEGVRDGEDVSDDAGVVRRSRRLLDGIQHNTNTKQHARR